MSHDTLLNLGAFVLQVFVIVAVAAACLRALRIASAGARYVCWRVVLCTCLAMPVVLHKTVTVRPLQTTTGVTSESAFVGGFRATDFVATPTATSGAPHVPVPWGTVVAAILVAGVLGRIAWLVGGLWRLRRVRRTGVPVDDADYDDIQQALGTRAILLTVKYLTQPATCGVWRPAVLLPETLVESPIPIRRAVVTHELFHVQRRDWAWVVAEEVLRSALWFHPAIVWLLSRIQLAREEVVDELTVLATGNRKAYIEALFAFADAGRLRPAPAFARRRHLFTRILRLSKESVMSSPRIVSSAAFVLVVVVASGWYAGSVFPLVSAASPQPEPRSIGIGAPLPRYQMERLLTYASGVIGSTAGSRSIESVTVRRQSAPAELRDAQGARSGGAPRPGPAAVQTAQTVPGGTPVTPENPIPRRVYSVPVAYPQELQGSGYSAAVEVRVIVDANGVPTILPNRLSLAMSDVLLSSGTVTAATARQRGAFSDAVVQSIAQWRYDPPVVPPLEFSIAVTFAPDRDGVVTQSAEPRGVSAVRGTVAVGSTGFGSNALDPAGRIASARLAEIDATQLNLQKRRALLAQQLNPLHPEIMALDSQLRDLALARERTVAELQQANAVTTQRVGQPIRVGGAVAAPRKIRDVQPVYPPVAESSRVQGVVIIETTIDEQGHVADARVLRSIPLLDQAAIDAVRQWEYTPTLLNGAPVPIIMTVTVQFTLAQ